LFQVLAADALAAGIQRGIEGRSSTSERAEPDAASLRGPGLFRIRPICYQPPVMTQIPLAFLIGLARRPIIGPASA